MKPENRWCHALGAYLSPYKDFLQEIDVVGGRQVDEVGRLLAVDGLVQMAVKKDVLHVQLMYRPGARGGDAEDNPDGGRFDNRAERLVVVDAVPLREATNNPYGFMTSQRAISIILVLEDPLPGDDVGTVVEEQDARCHCPQAPCILRSSPHANWHRRARHECCLAAEKPGWRTRR